MPDSASISSRFGRFRSLARRLDDLEGRVVGGGEVGETLIVDYWTGEEGVEPIDGYSFTSITPPAGSTIVTIGDVLDSEDEDGFMLLAKSGGYQVRLQMAVTLSGEDFGGDHPHPIQGLVMVQLIDDPDEVAFPPPGPGTTWMSTVRPNDHDVVVDMNTFAIVGGPSNDLEPALGRYVSLAYQVPLPPGDPPLPMLTTFSHLRLTMTRTISSEALIEDLR